MKRVLALVCALLLVASVADAKRRPGRRPTRGMVKKMKGKRGAAAAKAAAKTAAPGPVVASPAAKAAAKQHYAAGETAFKAQKFDEALKEYRAAHDAWPLDGFLFNVAQCYRNLGRSDEAITWFEKYAAAPNIKNRAEVDAVLAELRQPKSDPAATTAVARVETPAAPVETQRTEDKPVLAAVTPSPTAVTPAENPPAAAVTPAPGTPGDKADTPVWKKGWFWGVTVGALVVVGGGVTAAALASTQLPTGTLGTADWR